ncbi:anti-sigma regulatory factor [Xanthomonas sp. 60]
MITDSGVQPVRNEQDIVLSRQKVRQLAVLVGLRLVDQTKLVTAASELARNAVIYGGGGDMQWETLAEGLRKGVRLSFIDQGPGIADLAQALTDGWSSGKGMGLGLSGSRRLVDQFELDSAPGQGTRIVITKWT